MHAPPPDALEWVKLVTGSRLEALEAVRQHRAHGPWRIRLADGSVVVLKVGDDRLEAARRGFATEAAALAVADAHEVPAPRLVAVDGDGQVAGCLAILESWVDGSSAIPRSATAERLRAFGRGLARIHAIALQPSDALPRRAQSMDGVDFHHDPIGDVLAGVDPPASIGDSLVHGDLWQGNTLWDEDRYVATLDWDFAGVGSPGIDLGTVRYDVALFHGLAAAEFIVDGWQQAMGHPPEHQPYWDLSAVERSPSDLAAWLPNFHAQGRTDLDLELIEGRRAEFVNNARARLR